MHQYVQSSSPLGTHVSEKACCLVAMSKTMAFESNACCDPHVTGGRVCVSLSLRQVLTLPSASLKSPMSVPFDAIKMQQPLANWPPHIDWMQTLGGVMTIGLDLQREPLDVVFPSGLCGRPVVVGSFAIKKGFKRISSALYVLMYAMQMDPEDDALQPMAKVLVNLRAIPVMYTHKDSAEAHTFDYIALSNRQSMRQRLNPLQLAFLMETMVIERSEKSVEYKGKPMKEKLFAMVDEYNKQPGVRDMKGWQIQPDERWALCNLSIGCTADVKNLLRVHLNKYKWADCALTRDHLRSTAWLLGSVGLHSGAPSLWKELLLIKAESQELFVRRYFVSFDKKNTTSKKSRVSFRLSVDEFNMQASLAAVYLALETKFFLDAAMPDDAKSTIRAEKLRMFMEGCALCGDSSSCVADCAWGLSMRLESVDAP